MIGAAAAAVALATVLVASPALAAQGKSYGSLYCGASATSRLGSNATGDVTHSIYSGPGVIAASGFWSNGGVATYRQTNSSLHSSYDSYVYATGLISGGAAFCQ
jgi:hypothetical protein